jgi:hypothetical protein
MFRYLLITYLSLTTVAGPFFCCCMLGTHQSKMTGCCTRIRTVAAPIKQTPSKHSHSHARCKGHHHHSEAVQKPESDSQQPVPCEREQCPCGGCDAKAIAIANKAVNFDNPAESYSVGDAWIVSTNVFPRIPFYLDPLASDEKVTQFSGGRDLLRAYCIMRC